MLRGISPVVGPELLAILSSMGHGDELVLGDSNFPAETCGKRLIRADGLTIPQLLEGILPLFPLDPYVSQPVAMMAMVEGDTLDPTVEKSYVDIILKSETAAPSVERVERFAFYERARAAFAVIATSDTAPYGNIILVKGPVVSA